LEGGNWAGFCHSLLVVSFLERGQSLNSDVWRAGFGPDFAAPGFGKAKSTFAIAQGKKPGRQVRGVFTDPVWGKAEVFAGVIARVCRWPEAGCLFHIPTSEKIPASAVKHSNVRNLVSNTRFAQERQDRKEIPLRDHCALLFEFSLGCGCTAPGSLAVKSLHTILN
jgi:hypothetical protein